MRIYKKKVVNLFFSQVFMYPNNKFFNNEIDLSACFYIGLKHNFP